MRERRRSTKRLGERFDACVAATIPIARVTPTLVHDPDALFGPQVVLQVASIKFADAGQCHEQSRSGAGRGDHLSVFGCHARGSCRACRRAATSSGSSIASLRETIAESLLPGLCAHLPLLVTGGPFLPVVGRRFCISPDKRRALKEWTKVSQRFIRRPVETSRQRIDESRKKRRCQGRPQAPQCRNYQLTAYILSTHGPYSAHRRQTLL